MANNKNKFVAEQPILELNKILRRNRSILKKLCPSGKAIVRREVMDAMGYDTNVFASIFMTSSKEVYYICYDYAFTPIMEQLVEKAVIVQRQHYMRSWNPWKFIKKTHP
ncbi:MAG TPA: hypothetical protein VK666_00435 [Chryseolinea sp.]|nr:hypothetical protein [Chryseolinea sp.]